MSNPPRNLPRKPSQNVVSLDEHRAKRTKRKVPKTDLDAFWDEGFRNLKQLVEQDQVR